MPPVLGPRPPSKMRLKSWAGWRAYAVVPSHTANTETSGPSRNSSMTTRSQVAAWARASARSEVTTTPLPAASASSLTTCGAPNSSRASAASSRCRARARAGRRDVGRGHHLLGEGLRPLELGGGPGRAVAGDPLLAYGVGDAGDQRGLRPDDHQVGTDAGSERRHVGAVHRVHVVQVATSPMPGLPGAACTSLTCGSRDQGEGEGVLAAAGADDEDLHGWTTTVCSRPGPTPTPQIFAPEICSSAST